MLEIRKCKTRDDFRAFFSLDEGFLREEARYIKMYAHPSVNPLAANGNMEYLLALRNGQAVFRAIAGVDRRCWERTGERRAYFSLMNGERDAEAAQAVIEKMKAFSALEGAAQLFGPVSFEGSGFFMGTGSGDFSGSRGIFTGIENTFSEETLLEAGFRPFQQEDAYVIAIPPVNPLSGLSQRIEERFGMRAERMKTGWFSEKYMKDIAEISGGTCRGDLLRTLARIRPFIKSEHSFVAVRDGRPQGYLLSLSARRALTRVTTVMTAHGSFTPPAAVILASAFLDSCLKKKLCFAEASVIDSENSRPIRMLSRLNTVKKRTYKQFIINIQ